MYSALIAYILGLLTAIRDKNQSRDRSNQTTNTCNCKLLPDGPITVVCIPPPKSDEDKTADKKGNRRKAIKFWVEVSGVFLLLVYTVFTGYQAYLTRKSTNATIEFFRSDERAWIEIEPIKPMLFYLGDAHVPRRSFRYELYPRNVGKTPARNVSMKAQRIGAGETFGTDAHSIENTQDKFLNMQFTDSATGKPINISGPPIPHVLAPNTVAPVPFVLDGQEPQVFPNGHAFYDFLVGRIDYVDQFGASHWMKFCFFVINQRGELRYCGYGNDEDRNQ
jgi:hypothetical protein